MNQTTQGQAKKSSPQQQPIKSKRPICSRCHRPTPRACICEGLPDTPLTLNRCHVLVLQHPHEARRKNRSLPLVELSLSPNSLTTVVSRRFGEQHPEAVGLLQNSDTVLLIFPEQQQPEADSLETQQQQQQEEQSSMLTLTEAKEYCQTQQQQQTSSETTKILIVVLDATWKYANEMDKANIEANQYPKHMKRVALSWKDPARPKAADKAFRFVIRTAPSQVHLSTAECIAWVLCALEEQERDNGTSSNGGDNNKENDLYSFLMKPLNVMVEKWNDCRRTLGDDRDKKRKQQQIEKDSAANMNQDYSYYGNAQVQAEEQEEALGLASRTTFFTNGDQESSGGGGKKNRKRRKI